MFLRMTAACLALVVTFSASARANVVGIPRHEMNYYASAQKSQNWCWAACIRMLYNRYGVEANQQQIVALTKGSLIDSPGSNVEIAARLNGLIRDTAGREFVARTEFGRGAPPPSLLVHELSQGRPVLIGYKPDPYAPVGHAVVLTAAEFIPSYNGPVVQRLVYRDPYPTPANVYNHGRVVVGPGFARQIEWYCRVSIRRIR